MRRTPRRAAATARSPLLRVLSLAFQPCTIKLRYEQRCVATNAARLRAATALVTPPAGWRMQFCLLAGIPSVLHAASSLRSCRRVFRKARKAQGRESTSTTEPDTAALGEPAAPRLCVP